MSRPITILIQPYKGLSVPCLGFGADRFSCSNSASFLSQILVKKFFAKIILDFLRKLYIKEAHNSS